MHVSSPNQLQKGSEQSRHAHLRAKATSIEHAMDIAIGAEGKPWDEEEAA